MTITPEPQKGNPMSDSKRVVIFDTTLRDGEQSPGISLDVGEKLEIAEQLARLGVDYLEAGFPVASQGDFEAVEAIARSVRGPVITGLSRTALKDVDRCWEAVQHAEQARIHVFIATSENHMANKLKMTPDQVKVEAGSAVAHAKNYTDDVEFSPEDASRSDFDFMCEVLQIAVDSGAVTLNIPDTVGFAIPQEFGRRIAAIRERVTGDYVISAHCHDDLGMAVANSLAAVEAGARQVEVAMNGIGERAGNAALEEIVMALRTRSEYFGGLDTNVRAEELAKTSRLVARLTGYPVQYNKAVVGRNAFAHEAGIHQHGMLEDRTTYEIMDPNAVGQDTSLVLGKHSGRHAFSDTLEKMGLKVQGDALNQAFARFKELADRKVEITDADLEAIVAAELNVVVDRRLRAVQHRVPRQQRRPGQRAGRAGPHHGRREDGSHGRGRRHDRRRRPGHPQRHRGRRSPDRLQRVVGDRRRRRPRRRGHPVRVRWREGVGAGGVHRCGGGVGSGSSQCDQQGDPDPGPG